MEELLEVLRPIKRAPDSFVLPETAILRQFITKERRGWELDVQEDEDPDERALSDIDSMTSAAHTAGVHLSRPVLEKPYTLFTPFTIYRGTREFEKEKLRYASRFRLEAIKSTEPKNIITRILYQVREKELDPSNVMVQLPMQFSKEGAKQEIDRLIQEAPGIRFVIIDTEGLRKEKDRRQYRRDMFAMMLLIRQINSETLKNSPIQEVLRFLIRTHLSDSSKEQVSAYINALKIDDIANVVKIIMTYRPAEQYSLPEYGAVSAALMSA
jgi:hypothetical protein